MERLWLSGTEKKYYQKVYTKLVESANKTQAKDLKKLAVSRAGINSDHSAIIVQKSFDQSSDKKHIDQTGFFYFMKYIAYLQNGGDPNDDITKIEKELPKPNLPSSSSKATNHMSSDLSSGFHESSLESTLLNSVQQPMNQNGEESTVFYSMLQKNEGEEEEQKRIEEGAHMAYEEPKQIDGQFKNEDEQMKNIEEAAVEQEYNEIAELKEIKIEENNERDNITSEIVNLNGQQQVEEKQEDSAVVQAEEVNQEEKIEGIKEVQKEIQIDINNENNLIKQEDEQIQENIIDVQNNINIEQQNEGIPKENSKIQEIQLEESLNTKESMRVDEIDAKQENLQAKQEEQDKQQQSLNKKEQIYQIDLAEDHGNQEQKTQIITSVPQYTADQNCRLITFGQDPAQIQELRNFVLQFEKEQQQLNQVGSNPTKDETNRNQTGQGFRNQFFEDAHKNPYVNGSNYNHPLSIVQEQILEDQNSKIKEGIINSSNSLEDRESQSGGSKLKGADVSAMNGISQLSFMNEGQSHFQQFKNPAEMTRQNCNTTNNQLELGKKQSSKQSQQQQQSQNGISSGQKVDDILGNHFQNGPHVSALDGISSLELDNIDQSVYEQQQERMNFSTKPQRQLSNNGINSQMPGFIEQKNREDEDNDDKLLMKSVMECNEFSKTDQNQIKIALDMLKSNREDSQSHKNRMWKEKPRKHAKIERWREACDNLFMKKHVLYEIHTQSDNGQMLIVERRYNHFKALHNYFENSVDYYGIIKPQLPSSNKTNIGSYLGSTLMDQTTLEQRKIDLENYLNLYLSNAILTQDKILCQFLEAKEFVPPEEKQFSYLDWMKNLASNAYNADFAELKEYVEAVLKTNMQEFFQQSENEIDTREIDEKMEKVSSLGESVNRLVMLMNEDIRLDTEQRISIDEFEAKFYNEADQKADEILKQEHKSGILDTLKKFKAELIESKNQIKQRVDGKVQVLQQFKFIQSLIESAKVAQQVLKRKITDRIILKKIKTSKKNKLYEQNNNKSDASEAKRKLDTVNVQYNLSEQIITSIQKKLTNELGSFYQIQQANIQEAIVSFAAMQKQSLMVTARINPSVFKLFEQ